MQIRAKLTFLYVFLTSLLIGTSFYLIYTLSVQSEEKAFKDQLYKKASTTANLLISVAEVDSSLLRIIDQNKRDIYSFENISIYNREGKELYTNNDSIHFHDLLIEFQIHLDALFKTGDLRIDQDQFQIVGGVHTFKGQSYAFMAGAHDEAGRVYLTGLKRTLIYVFFSILCITGFVGWLYAGRMLQPINRIIQEMDQISAGELNKRLLPGNNQDELQRLSIKFNELLERLELAFNDQQTYIAHASHELNNPLATIRTEIEVARLSDRTSEEYVHTIDRIRKEVIHLQEVISQLLLLSRLTSQQLQLQTERVRLDELILEVQAEVEKRYPEKQIQLSFNLPEEENDLYAVTNRIMLRTVLLNLTDNAAKYTSDNIVHLHLEAGGSRLIRICNRTETILPKDLDKIFEPFFRKENETGTNGFGLGLTIVQKIARTCRYDLSCRLEKDLLCFELILN